MDCVANTVNENIYITRLLVSLVCLAALMQRCNLTSVFQVEQSSLLCWPHAAQQTWGLPPQEVSANIPLSLDIMLQKKTMNWGVLIEHILWRQHASHGTSAVTGPRNTPFDVISRLAIQTQPSCYASLPVPLWVQRETLQRASQFLKIRYLVFISTWWTGLSLRAAAAPWRFSVG